MDRNNEKDMLLNDVINNMMLDEWQINEPCLIPISLHKIYI